MKATGGMHALVGGAYVLDHDLGLDLDHDHDLDPRCADPLGRSLLEFQLEAVTATDVTGGPS